MSLTVPQQCWVAMPLTPDGTITMTNIGGTGENTVHDAIQAINTVANAGWNLQTNGDTASKQCGT